MFLNISFIFGGSELFLSPGPQRSRAGTAWDPRAETEREGPVRGDWEVS